MIGLAISPARRLQQRGSTVILFTMLCSLLLIPIAGLAIDGAVVFLMKAKLSAAVDAAALATARGLSVGSNLAQQTAAANATADSYFAANLPSGTLGSTVVGGVPVVTLNLSQGNTMQVSIQATITVPLYLMRILGFQFVTLVDSGQASRRVSNIILVLDRSFSIYIGGQCSNLISSAENFVNDFVDGRDTLGLVDFQASANEDFIAASNFKSGSPNLNSYINNLQCTGYTNTAQALVLAYARLKAINQPLANNVIVLFTDGNADTISAQFPLKSLGDTIYNWQPINSSSQSTTYVNPSNCGATLKGVLVNLPGGLSSANDVGGLYQDTAQPITWVSPYEYNSPNYPYPAAALSGSNCAFTSTQYYSYPTNTLAVRNDIAYIPATDDSTFANSFSGYWTQASDYFVYGLNTRLRADTVQSVNDAALNDADNMANTIRSDTNLNPTIYTIGLGNPPYEVINTTFLERIANDTRAPGYNSGQPTGLFINCTPSGLQSAFQQIASQILRLSR